MLSHKPGGLTITSCNPKEMYNSTILWDCIEWNKSFGKALKLQKGLENPSIPSCSGKTKKPQQWLLIDNLKDSS
jgi:hypothetical protein